MNRPSKKRSSAFEKQRICHLCICHIDFVHSLAKWKQVYGVICVLQMFWKDYSTIEWPCEWRFWLDLLSAPLMGRAFVTEHTQTPLETLEEQAWINEIWWFLSFRCEAVGEPAVCREHPGADQQRSDRVHALLVPSVSGQVQSAHTAASWGSLAQRAGWGLSVLQTPVWRGAMQQSPDWNASCQEIYCDVKGTRVHMSVWEFKPYVHNFPKAIISYSTWMYRMILFVYIFFLLTKRDNHKGAERI